MVGEPDVGVDADAQRMKGVVLGDDADVVGNAAASADQRIGRDLRAAISVHLLLEIMIAGESADTDIVVAHEIEAEVDAAIEHLAVLVIAHRARIRNDERLEILVVEIAFGENAAAEIALHIDAAGMIGAAEALDRMSAQAVIGQARDQSGAGNVVEIFRGLADAEPVARAEFAFDRGDRFARRQIPDGLVHGGRARKIRPLRTVIDAARPLRTVGRASRRDAGQNQARKNQSGNESPWPAPPKPPGRSLC